MHVYSTEVVELGRDQRDARRGAMAQPTLFVSKDVERDGPGVCSASNASTSPVSFLYAGAK